MNQQTWVENMLQEAEERVLSRTASETPIPKEKVDKRAIDSDSPVTKFSTKEFKIYTKKLKSSSNSKIEFPSLEYTQGTIVL